MDDAKIEAIVESLMAMPTSLAESRMRQGLRRDLTRAEMQEVQRRYCKALWDDFLFVMAPEDEVTLLDNVG